MNNILSMPLTVPSVRLGNMSLAHDDERSWRICGRVEIRDVAGTVLVAWDDDDLTYTLTRVHSGDGELELPDNTSVTVLHHEERGFVEVCTWILEDRAQYAFPFPVWSKEWSTVERAVSKWLESQDPAIRNLFD